MGGRAMTARTPEEVVAGAITAYWKDESRSGPNRGPVGHDHECAVDVVAALRDAGLLAGPVDGDAREALVGDDAVERAARALNLAGWTCEGGGDEPGRYDECEDCRRVTRPLARAALKAARAK